MMARTRIPGNAVPRRGTRPYGLQWANTELALPLISLGVAGQLSVNIGTELETALGRTIAGGTVMRVRGSYILRAGATPLAGAHAVYMGIGFFSDGIDNGDFPDLSAGQGNWLFYQNVHYSHSVAPTTNEQLPTGAQVEFPIDSKAKRKAIGNELNLMLVAQLGLTGGDTTITGDVRVLYKTP